MTTDVAYDNVVKRVRSLCLALPETHEEPAWIGLRWKIRNKTFAHVADIQLDTSPAFVRALGSRAPAVVVSFRSVPPELDALQEFGPPFFFGGWGRGQVLFAFDDDSDWSEVSELITESYRIMAPKMLASRVTPPAVG